MKKKNEKFNRKEIDVLLEGSKGILISTTNGSGICGNEFVVLNLLANLVNHMKKQGINKKDIEEAVDRGLNGVGIPVGIDLDDLDTEDMEKLVKEVVKNFKSMLENIKKDIEEDKDEDEDE